MNQKIVFAILYFKKQRLPFWKISAEFRLDLLGLGAALEE
jgi:hypothetical protein